MSSPVFSSRSRRAARAAMAATALLMSWAASAQTALPPATYRLTIGGLGQYTVPGQYQFAGASLSAVPFPQPALEGSAIGNPASGAGVEGSIAYFFAVDGPLDDIVVPMLVTFALSASVESALANASAVFGLSFAHSGDFTARVDADGRDPAPSGLFETRAFEMISGGPTASASLGIGATSFSGRALAYADPFIAIDPGFLATHPGYTVRVSAGIGNAPLVSAVPEPETWATMLLGLVVLAAARRRRQRARSTCERRRAWPLAGLLAGLALATTTARADDEPPALAPAQFALQAQSVFLGQQGSAVSNLFFASGSLDATGPRVAVQGEGVSSVVSADNAASAQALWSFFISGPVGVAVPILITGLYSAEQSNALSVNGGVAMGLDRFRLNYLMTFRCIDGDESGCDSSRGGRAQDFVLHEAATSGALTFLQIATGGALRGRGVGGLGSFSAFIDPLVSIDPTFARAGEFTLHVSPGAGGFVTAVPEPETWALLVAGLAVVGSVARRRQPRR